MCAAFIVSYSVDLVDDNSADAPKMLPALTGGKQNVERFRGGNENMGRVAKHRCALFRQSVASADAGADLGAEIAALECKLLYLCKWTVKILLNIVRERLERADVDDLGARS